MQPYPNSDIKFFYISSASPEAQPYLLGDTRITITLPSGMSRFDFSLSEHYIPAIALLAQNKDADMNRIDSKSYTHKTLLHTACTEHDTDLVAALLSSPHIDLNKEDYFHDTPFTYACQQGYTDIVRLFLKDPRTKVNYISKDMTGFQHAHWGGHTHTIAALLEDPRVKVFDAPTRFCYACQYGYFQSVRSLFAQSDPSEQPKLINCGLSFACIGGRTDIASFFHKDPRIDVNAETSDGWTGFHFACRNYWPSVVFLLLRDTRVDITKKTSLEEQVSTKPICPSAMTLTQNMTKFFRTRKRRSRYC